MRLLAVIGWTLAGGLLVLAQDRANPDAAAVKAFADRTRAYMLARGDLVAHLPALPPDASSAAIAAHTAALSHAIRAMRSHAQEGDFFAPDIAARFRRIIRNDLQARDVRDALATVAEVPRALAVHVGDSWPGELPHATVPPRLLASLYGLPEGLEYRFLDRHLVLLDTEADLVLDLVRDVIPSSLRRRP